MTKEQFLEKHKFNELDYRNLERYEQVRANGEMNMFEYLSMMKAHNLNGGSKLATWIQSGTNYAEFMEVLENEKNNYEVAHELWLKLKDAFNAEAEIYNNKMYQSKIGSVGPVKKREVLRSMWWDFVDGDSYGDYRTIINIIEMLHDGEELETGIIYFGS